MGTILEFPTHMIRRGNFVRTNGGRGIGIVVRVHHETIPLLSIWEVFDRMVQYQSVRTTEKIHPIDCSWEILHAMEYVLHTPCFIRDTEPLRVGVVNDFRLEGNRCDVSVKLDRGGCSAYLPLSDIGFDDHFGNIILHAQDERGAT